MKSEEHNCIDCLDEQCEIQGHLSKSFDNMLHKTL